MYNENFKTMKKELEEDTRRWKNFPCSWIGRVNTVNMTILPKAIYRFNKKFQSQFFTDMGKTLRTFTLSHQKQGQSQRRTLWVVLPLLISDYTTEP